VIVARVQRLVQIAHQVQQELERHEPLFFRGLEILELRVELVDFVDDAVLGRSGRGRYSRGERLPAVAGAGRVHALDLEIDEVPIPRTEIPALARIAVRVAELVGPRGFVRHVALDQTGVIVAQQLEHAHTHGGLKIVFRNEPDDFVPLIAPRSRRTAAQAQKRQATARPKNPRNHGAAFAGRKP
jgi:hypothetical protein